jgi:hypothetical protein
MQTTPKQPTQQMLHVRDVLLQTLKQEAADVPAQELLAIVSHVLGQLIAMQDQRKMSPSQAMMIVSANIEQGNREALRAVSSAGGTKQ